MTTCENAAYGSIHTCATFCATLGISHIGKTQPILFSKVHIGGTGMLNMRLACDFVDGESQVVCMEIASSRTVKWQDCEVAGVRLEPRWGILGGSVRRLA